MTQDPAGAAFEPDSDVLDAFVGYMQQRAAGAAPSFSEYCRERPGLEPDLRRLMGQWAAAPQTAAAPEPAGLERDAPSAPGSHEILTRLARRGATNDRYELRGELARGGMGVIVEAWDRDLRRKLAAKTMRSDIVDWDDGQRAAKHLARFLDEAQITGQLDHPGIVPVHELGLLEDGSPFFSMRLVQGSDLKSIFDCAWNERDGWRLTRVVDVLLKVCETMAFAHSRRVLHRDLKPSNVMVGRFGEVYVMDWGLARVRGRKDTRDVRPDAPTARDPSVHTESREVADATPQSPLVTMDGDVLGTPSYMPPEQARGRLDEIDERADIYAVGAMLYELLTRQAPFAPEGARVGPLAILARVLAGPPPDVSDLAPQAPSELAAICARAMARSPDARYATMADMADDLRAYLEGRVVRAYESGALAELRSWTRRNRKFAAASAAGVLIAVLGASATLYAQSTGRRAAQLEAESSREVTRVLSEMFERADPRRTRGANLTAMELLDDTAGRLESDLAQQPVIRARLQHTIARAYKSLGAHRQSRALLEQVLATRQAKLGADHPDTLAALEGLGDALQREGRPDLALPHYQELRRARVRKFGERAPPTLAATSDIAVVFQMLGSDGDAEAHFRLALDGQDEALGPEHDDTLRTLGNYAVYLRAKQRNDEARQLLERVLDARVRRSGIEHIATLRAQANLAFVESELGNHARSEQLSREVLAIRERIDGPEHPDTLVAARALALALEAAGDEGEAERLLRVTLESRRRVFGDRPATRESLRDLARRLVARGELDEARLLTLELLRTTPPNDPAIRAVEELARTLELAPIAEERP